MGFSKFILKIRGWKVTSEVQIPDKCIIVICPHTSLWDFIWGKFALTYLGHNTKFLIKKEFFFFPVGPIIKSLGSISVDRGKYKSNMVGSVSENFKKFKEFKLVITPEGTRKKTKHWKKGFWEIARESGVPVVYGYVDYKKKEMKIVGILDITDNWDHDIALLKSKYAGVTAKNPEHQFFF